MKRKGKFLGHPRAMAVFPTNFNYTGMPSRQQPIKPFGLSRLMMVRSALAKPQVRLT